MKYTLLVEKFSSKKQIYKEDLVDSLTKMFGIGLYDCEVILDYINYSDDISREDIEKIFSDRIEKESELRNIMDFLETLGRKHIVHKRDVKIVENSLVELVESLLLPTNGSIKYKVQLDTVINTIGRIFMWSKLEDNDTKSSEELQIYFIKNMHEYRDTYPGLTHVIVEAATDFELRDNDILYLYPLSKERLLLESYRKNIKTKNKI